MKPAILHVIHRNPYGDVRIMAVTTVKARRYYGRDDHGEPTNCAARDAVATLPTGERAQAVLDKVREMEKTRRERNAVASKACSAAYRANDEWFADELKRTLAT